MSVQFIGLLTIIAGVAILRARIFWAFATMVVTTVFGAAAAINLPALGGASVLVPSLFLVFFGARLFMAYGEGPILGALVLPSPGFWLFILTAFGIASAFAFPAFFKGAAETMTVSRVASDHSFISLTPLRFTSNNITQSVYAAGGLVAFAGAFAYFRRAGTPDHFFNAIIAVAVVDLGFAALDVITYFTHTDYLLSFIRTANYALLTDAEKGGFKRISGSFPEASSFSNYTTVLLAVVGSLWLDLVRTRITGILAVLLLLALLLSTSATALVSVGVVLPLLWLRSLAEGLRYPARARVTFLLGTVALVPLVALTLAVLFPDVIHGLMKFLNEMLLSKASSQSGRERLAWNEAAYQTFLATSGYGAGLGSARASSFILVLLSNLGVIGTLLFAFFVYSVLATNRHAKDKNAFDPTISAMRAAKIGVVAVLVPASISGTVYDLGLMFYLLAGTCSALALPQSTQTSLRDQHSGFNSTPIRSSRVEGHQ